MGITQIFALGKENQRSYDTACKLYDTTFKLNIMGYVNAVHERLSTRAVPANKSDHDTQSGVGMLCMHIYNMVTGTMWAFRYKEVVICTYAAAKWIRILLKFYCFLTIF